MKALNINNEQTPPITQITGKVSKSVASSPKVVKTIPITRSTGKNAKKEVVNHDTVNKEPTKKGTARKIKAKKAISKALTFDREIMAKLKKMVANYTEYPELLDSIERDTTKSFIDELNIDSVDFVEIIVDVEQEFNITIEDDEIYNLNSFEDLYFAIETKIKGTKK